MARVLYGLLAGVDDKLARQLDAGEVVLGGCIVEEGAPQWACVVGCEEAHGFQGR